jgi:hypothetical protein
MGQKVAKLKPVDGFCAEFGAAITLFISSSFGIPVSTTHTITGSIMGVGSVKRLSAVRWGVAGRIVWAWILTIPCSAIMSALAYTLVRKLYILLFLQADLMPFFYTLDKEKNENDMIKAAGQMITGLIRYIKVVIDDEMKSIDHFYEQYA